MSESAILATLRSIEQSLKFREPYFERFVLSKASQVTAFDGTLRVDGQEFNQYLITTDGDISDISYQIKNLRAGISPEIEARKLPYVVGPVTELQFKNDTAEAGKSIFVDGINISNLSPAPPMLLEQAALFPSYRSGNFITDGDSDNGRITENNSGAIRWTYTVPTGKRALSLGGSLGIVCEIAATSSTTTDRIIINIKLDSGVTTAKNWFVIVLNTVAMVAGDRSFLTIPAGGLLDAGDVVTGNDIFEGDAAGAGVVLANKDMAFAEWDA